MSTARRLRALRPTSTPRNRPPCGSSYSTRMCSMRMAFATLVLVIYQGLFIDVIARSLYATGSKSIGIATRQPLQSLPTCISIHHFLHPALPFYTLPSARAPRNTASLYCPSSDCNPYAPDCNLPPSQAKAQPHRPVPQASSISSSSQHHLPPYTHLSTRAPQTLPTSTVQAATAISTHLIATYLHFRRKHSPKCQFHKQVHTHVGHYEGPGPRVPEKKATRFIFTISKHEIHCTLQPEQA